MADRLSALESEGIGAVTVDLSDEYGAPLYRIPLDGDLTVGELAAQAAAFELPEGEDYALYGVTPGPGRAESAQRLAPDTRLGQLPVPDDGIVRLRFAQALRGAK
jgi:hypothetical protein